MSLGKHIIVSQWAKENTIKHEYGHCRQSKMLGWLYKMQIYFGECFDVSESHKQSVDSLESTEDIEVYDFESNFPEKLTFDLE